MRETLNLEEIYKKETGSDSVFEWDWDVCEATNYKADYVEWLENKVYELENYKKMHTKHILTREQYQQMITPNSEANKKRDELFKKIENTVKVTDLGNGIRQVEFLEEEGDEL